MANDPISVGISDALGSLKESVETGKELVDISTALSKEFAKHGVSVSITDDALRKVLDSTKKTSVTAQDVFDLAKRSLEQKNEELKAAKKVTDIDRGRLSLLGKQRNLTAEEKSEYAELKEQADLYRKAQEKIAEIEPKGARSQLKILEDAVKESYKNVKAQELLNAKQDAQVRTLGKLKGATGELGSLVEDIFNTMKDIVKNPFVALIVLATLAVKQFVSMDLAAEAFRRKTGLTIKQTAAIRVEAERITREFANAGITIDKANESASELAETFFGNARAVKENMQFVALMSALLDVAEGDIAKVLQTFMGISGVSSATAQNLSLYAGELSRAAGVPFSKVMKDIAGLSERSLAAFRGNSIAMIKATVEARRLGTTIKDIANTTTSLLDFENTFNSEMELSVLLGKNVNLMEMRRKAIAGDMVGLMQEQTKFLRDQDGLTGKNVFQIEAMAKAMGLSVDAMTKMVAQQELQNDLEAKSLRGDREATEELKKRKAYEDLLKKSSLELEKDSIKRSRMLREQNQMQGQMNSMMNELQKMGLQLGSVLFPIVKVLADILVPILQVIGAVIQGFISQFKLGTSYSSDFSESFKELMPKVLIVANALGSVLAGVTKIYLLLGKVAPIAAVITSVFGRLAGIVTSIAPSLARIIPILKIGGMFAKWLPIVGWIIMGLQFIFSLVKRFSDIKWGDSIGENILLGLKAIGLAIYDVLLKPFKDAWDWVKSLWGGNSPSKVGLSILEGIQSIGTMIFDALTWPYRKAWHFVTGLFSKNGDLVKSVSVEVSTNKIITNSAEAAPDNTMSAKTTNEKSVSVSDGYRVMADKIDELISLMKSGGISATVPAVYLDGQKVHDVLLTHVA